MLNGLKDELVDWADFFYTRNVEWSDKGQISTTVTLHKS